MTVILMVMYVGSREVEGTVCCVILWELEGVICSATDGPGGTITVPCI